MVQGLAPYLRRLDKNNQVLDQLRLARKFGNGRRADIVLKLLVGMIERIVAGM
jgi:hypothetical protein